MIVTPILLGLAANADNLTIGIGYGVQHRRIRVRQNLLIAAVTTAVTAAALAGGTALHRHLLSALPAWLGGAVLILFALSGLLRPQRRSQGGAGSGVAGWREIALLAAALSVNNIGLAVAGGFAGMRPGIALASVFGFSILLLSIGQRIGWGARRQWGTAVSQPWMGHLILLAAGVMMVFGL